METFKRILITRTDRIGDVLLSTPVIKAIRKRFPKSYIAVIVRPYARDIVFGNPYLDEVIIYDKYGTERSVWQSLKFARNLRKKNFDLALILHPTNRMHLLTFLAAIKKRIGYNRKMSFLLTDRIEHKKQEGQKHERDYALDLIRFLGIETEDKDLFMPVREDSQMYIEKFLNSQGVRKGDRLVALHPGASCPSKIWPVERFARVANRIFDEFKTKIVVVTGPDDIHIGKDLLNLIHCPYIDASGKTTVSQLGSLLRRCSLFISNDSGPVHIAQAQGVPCVVIFGRSQPGLSPRRWGPTNSNSIVMHKDVGCKICLAHNCQREFICLKAISEEEVLSAAEKFLKSPHHIN